MSKSLYPLDQEALPHQPVQRQHPGRDEERQDHADEALHRVHVEEIAGLKRRE